MVSPSSPIPSAARRTRSSRTRRGRHWCKANGCFLTSRRRESNPREDRPMSEDRHARPSGSTPEPLYDVNIPTPTHAERARTLVAQITTGTLCTVALEPEGYPYGSFVTVAFDDANPVFLISGLAEHTRNLERDHRASLLVAEGGAEDPLANGRVTMLGLCSPVEGDGGRARAAFLAAHPNAAYYADFRDFAFWKLRVNAIRYICGYGRMSWVSQADWQAAEPDPLTPSAAGT